jgi:hypothetical protein
VAKGHKRFLKKQGIPLPFSFQAAPHIYQYIGAAGFSLAGGGKGIA